MDWNEALHNSIAARDAEQTREALEHGADPNCPEIEGFEGATPLYWAAAAGSLEIVSLLIEAGATVAAEHDKDSTSLHEAADSGRLDILRLLLATDIGPHLGTFDDMSRTPLHCAVQAGHAEAARLLLDAGANVNAREEAKIGNPPLRDAVENGDLPMVRLLLEHGADPLLPGWMRLTPLDKAKGNDGDRPRIRALIEDAIRSQQSDTRFRRDTGHPRRKR